MISKRSARVLILCLLTLSVVSGGAFAANDPLFGQQWALHRIQAEPAWGPAAGGSGVIVAVVDTGVNFGHPDLAGRSAGELNAIERADTACKSAPGDNNGHGTQVAGIIAANANNGQGIASVAPGAGILSVKALDCRGSGYLSDVARGIRMAVDHNARVVNLSLGYEIGVLGSLVNGLFGQDEVREFQAAINYAASKNSAVIAAAGNDALQSSYAGMDNVLVVGASGPRDENSIYSSSGAEIMAPGGNSSGGCGIESCVATTERGGGYAAVQGTSFAAPHVSGVAALLFRQGHGAPGVRSVISATADSVQAGPRVNAARAVGAPVPPPQGSDPGPGVQAQGTGENAGSLPAGSGAGSAAAASAAKAQNSTPAAQAATPGVTSPAPDQPAPTLVLGAAQGPPPEVSKDVAGYAEGAGAGGRAEGASPVRAEAQGKGWRNALVALALTTAVAGGYFYWKRRRFA